MAQRQQWLAVLMALLCLLGATTRALGDPSAQETCSEGDPTCAVATGADLDQENTQQKERHEEATLIVEASSTEAETETYIKTVSCFSQVMSFESECFGLEI